jgi:beta-N-acetylhexosaminidase
LGGYCFLQNGQSAANILANCNQMQQLSDVPLLISIDAEAGLGARVADATVFPLLMGFGAADDPSLTEACGRITARECRAIGVNVAYGPVVDVNTEPINPIISTRSFSDDPDRVSRLAQGFIHGARAEGVLCTFKHYPGHGATTGDSHSSLPTVDLPLSELQAVHIKPYRDLVATGDVDLVMTAHVWYSQVDTVIPWPATLSPTFLTDILRDDLGYTGLVTSDSYGMAGLAIAVPDEAERAVEGIEAGLDVILNPPTVSLAFNGIRDAVTSGRISEERINESVRRVLILKSRAGLPEAAQVDPGIYPTVLRHPDHLATVRTVCERAFTEGKNTLTGVIPISPEAHVLLLSLGGGTTIFYRMSSTFFTDPFTARVPNTDLRSVSSNINSSDRAEIVAAAQGKDAVIILGYDWWHIGSTRQLTLIDQLTALDVPVIYVSFGAPYHYLQIPDVDAFYCGYSSVDAMQQVAVEVLLGDRPAVGELPVLVPGLEPQRHLSGLLLH